MKKTIALLIAMLMILSTLLVLSSCGSYEEDSTTRKSSDQSSDNEDTRVSDILGFRDNDETEDETTAEPADDDDDDDGDDTDVEPVESVEDDDDDEDTTRDDDDDVDVIDSSNGDIVGKWRGEIDYGPMMSDDGLDFSEYGIDLSGSYVGIYFDFTEDGECTISFDKDDFEALMVKAFEQMADYFNMTVDELASAIDYDSIDDYIDELVEDSSINEEFSGSYSYSPGKLSFNEAVFETTLSGSEFVLKRVISGSVDDIFSDHILPLTLHK